jgi:hypothetical protein
MLILVLAWRIDGILWIFDPHVMYCRFVEPELQSALLDILWSDPAADDQLLTMTNDDCALFLAEEWRPNPCRGCSYIFGYKAIRRFLDEVRYSTFF